MIALSYTLHLLGPVLATSLQGDPNSATTFPYIPGSLVRGALIARYLAQDDAAKRDFATNATSRALFLDGQTRYLPAHLQIEGQRTLPAGLSWYKEKDDELSEKIWHYTLHDKAHREFDEDDFWSSFNQPKQLPAQFCWIRDNSLTLHNPDTQISIHTQRERRAGRATEDDGAVFRYEALAPGQSFGGMILSEDEQWIDQIEKLLTGILSVGGSRSAGYGRVQVENVRRVNDWTETGDAPEGIEANAMFSITLLSDTILRDEKGQDTDVLTADLLAEMLEMAAGTLRSGEIFKQNTWVGGFNRKWGLPLPQTLAVKAGSVFCFRTTQEISAARLERLLWNGIGERRTEGFGRLAVNWPDYHELTVEKYEEKSDWLKMPTLETENSQKLARRMNERLLRRDADLALNNSINQMSISKTPKKSQLGSVRIAIRQALHKGTLEPLEKHLQGMQRTARDQFEKSRLAGSRDSLFGWLEDRIRHPAQIWNQIQFQPSQAKLVGSEARQSDRDLEIEYTLRFIDGVLAKAAKEGGNE